MDIEAATLSKRVAGLHETLTHFCLGQRKLAPPRQPPAACRTIQAVELICACFIRVYLAVLRPPGECQRRRALASSVPGRRLKLKFIQR